MAAKQWTDAEKLGLLFQIIEKAGPIPWDDLKLPEGRTKKACTVMIDKEKQKVKKAREADGGGTETPEGGKKREAADDGEASPSKKAKAKPKTPKKKKVKAGEDEATDDEGDVKAEPKEDDED